MHIQTLSAAPGLLSSAIQGAWWLLSREDRAKDESQRVDPALGADPIGILTYTGSHFAAQFMKRIRTSGSALRVFDSGQNNTSALAGYDAYFGNYEVNEQTGKVAHTLIGSLNPSNIGITLFRDLQVCDDTLTIRLETTTPEGEAVTRTLVWKRIS